MKKKIDWWLCIIPFLILVAIIFYIVGHLQKGILSTVAFDMGPDLISLTTIITAIIAIIYSLKHKPFFRISRIIGFILLVILFFNRSFYDRYPSYYDDKPSKVAFRVPTDTELTVCWGGKEVKQNYHAAYSNQVWAYDLIMTKDGKSYSGKGDKVTDYYCYGVEILAPATGKIVKVFDADPDMPIGVVGGGTTPFGNHIIIKVAKKEYLYICHLKPKSIVVREGDEVIQGQKLGLIGNSGNTDEPHIHIHLEDGLDYGEGIPMYFHNLIVNGTYQEKAIPIGGLDDADRCIGAKIKNSF